MDDAACIRAQSGLGFVAAVESGAREPGSETCAELAGLRALDACPRLASAWGPRVSALREAELRAREFVQISGEYFIEGAPRGTAVWARTPQGPELQFRLRGAVTEVFGSTIVIPTSREQIFADLADGRLSRVAGSEIVARTPRHVVVKDGDRFVRVSRATLQSNGVVQGIQPEYSEPHALYRDDAVGVWRNVLASFESGKVLRDGVLFGRGDDKGHIAACDQEAREILHVEIETGKTIARYKSKGSSLHGCGDADLLPAAYARDGRYLFWFESDGGGVDKEPSLTVVTADTKTGKVRRFHDADGTWPGDVATAHTVEDGNRLCMRAFYHRLRITQCDWTVSTDGRVARSVWPPPGAQLKELSLDGVTEETRALSPSGKRTAIVTFRSTSDELTDVRITVAERTGSKWRHLRTFPLDASSFLPSPGHEAAWNIDVYEPSAPWYATPGFIGERFLTFPLAPDDCRLMDVESGETTKLSACVHTGGDPPLSIGGGVLLDPVNGTELRLNVSAAEWSKAPFLLGECGE